MVHIWKHGTFYFLLAYNWFWLKERTTHTLSGPLYISSKFLSLLFEKPQVLIPDAFYGILILLHHRVSHTDLRFLCLPRGGGVTIAIQTWQQPLSNSNTAVVMWGHLNATLLLRPGIGLKRCSVHCNVCSKVVACDGCWITFEMIECPSKQTLTTLHGGSV